MIASRYYLEISLIDSLETVKNAQKIGLNDIKESGWAPCPDCC